jgi:glycosyltransferase involved in cell wall biosynthesis
VKPARHRLAFRTAVRRSARSATRVVAVSRTTAEDAERLFGLPAGSVATVPNGVDEAFRPGSRDDARALVHARLGVEGPFVLAVGSLEPRKGLDVLVDAATVAQARGAPWRLVLAGAPGFRGEEIAARARASAACTVLGSVGEEELLALYRAADALAAPSLYEGFGLTPLEALACGTPAVVAGGSGGLVETVGDAAIVVVERDPESWADALERASAEREQRAQAGLRHAERFRWPAVAEQLLGVFTEAVAARR